MIHAILAILIMHVSINLVGFSLSGSQPAVSSAVSAGITASDTTIPVDSATGFPGAGFLYIRGEAMTYTANETPCATGTFAGQPACFTGAARGQLATGGLSHPIGARVYNESIGTLNNLATFEQRTSIDELGEVTTPWGAGAAVSQFLAHSATWDWPMFDGPFGYLRVFGALFTIAIGLGIFIVLGSLLVSGLGAIRR